MLGKLRKISMELYERYRSGLLSKDEYLGLIRPVDEEIDRLEQESICWSLQKSPIFKIPSNFYQLK